MELCPLPVHVRVYVDIRMWGVRIRRILKTRVCMPVCIPKHVCMSVSVPVCRIRIRADWNRRCLHEMQNRNAVFPVLTASCTTHTAQVGSTVSATSPYPTRSPPQNSAT